MKVRAAILGASGYGGGELLRLLAAHPSVSEVIGASRSNAGKPVASVHPNLRGIVDSNFVEKIDWDWLAEENNSVLFCAMPHGEFAQQYEALSSHWNENLTVIDLSADFRISCASIYKAHYKGAHPCPDRLKEWTYGFPELNRSEIAGAKRISSPGCFATALQLALLPILRIQGIDYVAASGATGSSGSGMSPSETTHHPTRSNDFRAYKILAHQHMAEVEQLLSNSGRESLEVSFVPHSAPIVRGILVTAQFILPPGTPASRLDEAVHQTYMDSRFVRIVEGSPRVAAVAGSNFADIGFAVKDRQAAILVAIDNLGKGMAGQAVQNMNLALGLEETEGLWHAGGFPY